VHIRRRLTPSQPAPSHRALAIVPLVLGIVALALAHPLVCVAMFACSILIAIFTL
jgi:hypothetical protein